MFHTETQRSRRLTKTRRPQRREKEKEKHSQATSDVICLSRLFDDGEKKRFGKKDSTFVCSKRSEWPLNQYHEDSIEIEQHVNTNVEINCGDCLQKVCFDCLNGFWMLEELLKAGLEAKC